MNGGYRQHIIESATLREREAMQFPGMFFLREAVRVAAFVALAIALSDVFASDTFDWEPGSRLRFIALFAPLGAAMNLGLIRWNRRRRTEA